MEVYFFDSSAIAKRYVSETGSKWVAELLEPSPDIEVHLARISGAEVVAAIAKRTRAGNLSNSSGAAAIAQFRKDFESRPRIVEITAPLVSRAMELAERQVLRGYDAVQMAAALTVNEACAALDLSMTFISADEELNAAAVAEGLRVENPNSH